MYHSNPTNKLLQISQQHEDSLDQEQEQPLQYALQPHHIELTFKKTQPNHPISHQQYSRSLFTQSERNIIKHLHHRISTYYQMSIDQLSQLPFADLYSLQLNDMQQRKLVLVGDILQLRRVRMKAKMVRVNQNCLAVKQNLSYQQRNKLYLLDLLLKQLSKKQLINTLQLDLKLKKFRSLYGELDNKEEYLSNPEIRMQSPQKAQQKYHILYEQEKQRQAESELSRSEQDADHSAICDKIWIMSQTLSSIIMKTMFSGFNSIKNYSKRSQRTAMPKPSSTSFQISPIKNYSKEMSIKSQQLILHEKSLQQASSLVPNIKSKQQVEQIQEGHSQMEVDQEDQQVQEGEQDFRGSETQLQLERLQDYIDQLIEECSETNDLQKRYFIKWKIFLLEKIAISIISRYRQEVQPQQLQNQQDEQQQEEEEEQQSIEMQHQLPMKSRHEQKNINTQKGKSELSIIEGWSRATSRLSQGESNLKEEKNELRLFLFHNQATKFLILLRKNRQQRQIAEIVDRVYERKTLMKVFQAMKEHYEDQRMLRQLDGYYQQVADQQEDDTDLPFFFWKTTQLHKYFKLFKENTRNNHLDRILQRFIRRYTFSTILNFSRKQLRSDEKINKWVLMRQKTSLFRFFNVWKQEYKSNNCYSSQIKSYILSKNKEMMRYYFSVLKLQFKKNLVAMHRADRYYYSVLKKKVFSQIKLLTQDALIFREKQSALTEHLYYRKANLFLFKFVEQYTQYIEYQRTIAKQQRLTKILSNKQIAQSFSSWRAHTLRKNLYKTIQDKLLRLNSKKKKRQILKLWKNRTMQKRGLQMQRSDKHKQWLVKYYTDLCSVVTP